MSITKLKASINNLTKNNVKPEIYTVYQNTKHQGIRGIVGLEKRMRNVPVFVAKAAKKGALATGLEAFEHAMRIVPVDTGKMANSGRLTINNEVYAKGDCDETGNTSVAIVKRDEGIVPTGEDMNILTSGRANVRVSFHRTNDEGENIALLTHETLLPHGSGPKKAKKAGTSGKFIEIPLQQVADSLVPNIQKEVLNILNKLN